MTAEEPILVLRIGLLTCACLGMLRDACGPESIQAAEIPARIEVELPKVVYKGVPVPAVSFTAVDDAGTVVESFNETLTIDEIHVGRGEDPHGQYIYQTRVPFSDGRATFTSDPAAGRLVLLSGEPLRNDGFFITSRLRMLPGWISLTPPLVAILLAIWLRQVLVALFVAVWSGELILGGFHPFRAFLRTIDTHVPAEILVPDDPSQAHLQIILFTLFLGGMISVMSASGGTGALVDRLAPLARDSRSRGQLLTSLMGLVIFFDDYANTLLVGTSMRPVTDRLRISREKLAFLVDATAAPVAGLAIISTWVGVEIGYIADSYARLGLGEDIYPVFLASILYRFYPIYLLAFVWLIAAMEKDFGPMWHAEQRALVAAAPGPQGDDSHLSGQGGATGRNDDGLHVAEAAEPPLLRNALVPLVVLVGSVLIGLCWTGMAGLARDGIESPGWTHILGAAEGNRVLLLASFIASLSAVVLARVTGALDLTSSVNAWVHGLQRMLQAVLVLVLAWGVATQCDASHLNTAAYLVATIQGELAPQWLPAVCFIVAGLISFATGSSWSTMGLLMPLAIPICFQLLQQGQAEVTGDDPLLLATIGAVLAGAIFGDHCSPISDTTILSSAACSCDHLNHVATQFPYALSVAGLALVLGYLPAGYGVSAVWLLPAGIGCLWLLIRTLGRPLDANS